MSLRKERIRFLAIVGSAVVIVGLGAVFRNELLNVLYPSDSEMIVATGPSLTAVGIVDEETRQPATNTASPEKEGTPPLDGLIAYYPFNGNANDESGNGNHGKAYGAVLAEDRFGNSDSAYIFDGNDDYINCGHSPLLDVNHHTILAWIKLDASAAHRRIVSKVNPHVHETIDLGISPDNLLRTNFATGSEKNHELLGSRAFENDRWYFVAVTYDGENVTLYVDGMVDNVFPRSGSVRTNDMDLAIGRHGGYSYRDRDDYFFCGSIDDVRIYNRALNPSEIQALYSENGWIGK